MNLENEICVKQYVMWIHNDKDITGSLEKGMLNARWKILSS